VESLAQTRLARGHRRSGQAEISSMGALDP
jgi:hypothetical protein